MNPAEKALHQALEADTSDWSVRLLILEKMLEREAIDEAGELIESAPNAPQTEEQLQRIIEVGGIHALEHAKHFVEQHPASGFAHHALGELLIAAGDEDLAANHLSVAKALGVDTGDSYKEEEPGDPVEDAPDDTASGFHVAVPAPAGPKKKRGPKATAALIAILVHAGILFIAAILVILPPARDQPEIIASVIGPPAKKNEMQKKNVVKQTKQSTSASAASAPIAQMMRANAMAKFALPEVTRTSTGPIGMGEGDLGASGFGTDSGLGSGGSFFGTKTKGNLAVIFDITASMYEVNPIVVAEIQKRFSDAHVVCVFGARFKDEPAKLLPYESNHTLLAAVELSSKGRQVAVAMNEALFSLKRCDSLEKGSDSSRGHSLGTAIENLLNQPSRPGTIFVFSDFQDGADPVYMAKIQDLVNRTNTRVVFWNPLKWSKDKQHYLDFAKATGGEVKEGKLKASR